MHEVDVFTWIDLIVIKAGASILLVSWVYRHVKNDIYRND